MQFCRDLAESVLPEGLIQERNNLCGRLLPLGVPSSLSCTGGAEFAEQFDRSHPKFHNGNPTVHSPECKQPLPLPFWSGPELRPCRLVVPGFQTPWLPPWHRHRSLSGNVATPAAPQAESKNWRDMPDAPLSLEVCPAVPAEPESCISCRISCRTSCRIRCRMIMVRSTRCSWTHIRPSTSARRSAEMGTVSLGYLRSMCRAVRG